MNHSLRRSKFGYLILLSLGMVWGMYSLHNSESSTYQDGRNKFMFTDIKTINDAVALFPTSAAQIELRVEEALADAQKRIQSIVTIDDAQRTYANSVKAFDELCGLSNIAILLSLFEMLEMVSPDEQVRKACHTQYLKLHEFFIDHISNNVDIYNALTAYATGHTESLDAEQRYFLDESLRDFKRAGLDLPENERNKVKALKKALAQFGLEFEQNIAEDTSTVQASADELTGVHADFIANLKKNDDGFYVLGMEYPTYFTMMETCTNAEIRKKMYFAFNNRAYPANKQLLETIITKRDQLAKLLGFKSYAHLDLDSEMIKHPDKAQHFLDTLIEQTQTKAHDELTLFCKELPSSVELSAAGKLYPWDVRFVESHYKKRCFNIDEEELAEYFPMDKTIEGLLSIYHQFFDIDFKEVAVSGLWHKDVKCMALYDKGKDRPLGYILLDLHPRPNKYTHACHGGIVPSTYDRHGNPTCGVSLMITNFPKAMGNKPALFKRDDVRTFFHEFGHAIHSRLGRTRHACFAGTSVKTDFVEMPSQMLEEWLFDTQVLTSLASHYKTKQTFDVQTIQAILDIKNFDKGYRVTRQAFLSLLSLNYFLEGESKDLDTIMAELHQTVLGCVEYVPDTHMYASFGHLDGYGAKYYSYLWSKVFALDLFETIKKDGLLNPEVGKKYIAQVIGKGGSQDPYELLYNFLGREPNQNAFLKDIGV